MPSTAMDSITDSDQEMPPPLVSESEEECIPRTRTLKRKAKVKAQTKHKETKTTNNAEMDGQGETLRLVGQMNNTIHAPIKVNSTSRATGRRAGQFKTLELFAGEHHLSTELANRGFTAYTMDILTGHDLSSQKYVKYLQDDADKNTFDYVHFAPPCNTFSCARFPRLRLTLQI